MNRHFFFFLLLLISSFSANAGFRFYYSDTITAANSFDTPAEACQAWYFSQYPSGHASWFVDFDGTGVTTQQNANKWSTDLKCRRRLVASPGYIADSQSLLAWSVSCPAGTIDGEYGTCVVGQLCPTAGDETTFWVGSTGLMPSHVEPLINVNDCEVSMTKMKSCRRFTDQDGIACEYEGTFTGNESASLTTGGQDQPANTANNDKNDDNLRDETSEVITATDLTNNPDGSTTAVDITNITETTEIGAQMWSDANNYYIKNSDGNVKVIEKTTTVVTQTDGSKQEIISIEWEESRPDPDVTIVSKNGQGKLVSQGGDTIINSGGNTVTNNYSTTGDITDTTQVTNIAGNGESGNGEEGEESHISSGTGNFTAPSGSWWDSDYPDGIDGIWEDHQASLDSSETVGWFSSWSFPNSGTYPSWTFDFYLLGSKTLEIPQYIWNILRAIILFTALVYSRRIVFGG
ncbi:MAG: hypothetical protein COA38_21790 [Fluviicola sp.]|nr:MAG: hypothetical protein COA38_21790 [Fluviicola sp.]